MVEKVEEAVGYFSVSCKFKNVGINLSGRLQEYMGQI